MSHFENGLFHVSRKEMGVAGLLGARLAREDFDEGRLTVHEQIEGGVNGGEIVELIEAIGAGAEFAGSLRAAEKEHAEQGDFVAVEIEDFREAVFELGDAAVGGGRACEALLAQRMERAADGVFIEIHDWIAIRFLVGGVQDGVQRKRVILGRGDFFFDERAQDASFYGSQCEVHGGHDTQRRDFARTSPASNDLHKKYRRHARTTSPEMAARACVR